MSKRTRPNRYQMLIERIFKNKWENGVKDFYFERSDLELAAKELKIPLPKNLGDVMYALRYRIDFPDSIILTQPSGLEWVIEGAGRARYRFRLVKKTRIIPRQDLARIDIPDSTPEIIRDYALDDEQALLAIVRYNRLIDIFLGLTTYSLQNHLRTTVQGIGQIEIDELYVGIDTHGCHYVVPVQAKGGNDQIGVVQTTQDIRFVEEKFPGIRCRAVSVQFMESHVVSLFELTLQDDEIRVAEERHYKLVPHAELDKNAIKAYR